MWVRLNDIRTAYVNPYLNQFNSINCYNIKRDFHAKSAFEEDYKYLLHTIKKYVDKKR